MFALAALICFILALFDVTLEFSLVNLGLACIAAHLLVGLWPFAGAAPWVRQP